jgi:NTP pyrophosphatase (non-canonical NTP hydrolase)
MDLRAAQALVADNKRAKGFNRDVPTELCLLHGEIAELFEAWRHGKPEMAEELADVAIYTLGLAALLDVDLQAEVEAKIAKNAPRRYERSPAGVPVRIDDGTG